MATFATAPRVFGGAVRRDINASFPHNNTFHYIPIATALPLWQTIETIHFSFQRGANVKYILHCTEDGTELTYGGTTEPFYDILVDR